MAQWAKMFNNLLEQESGGRSEKTKTCVQRDLEDQIAEEYARQGRVYKKTEIKNLSNMSTSEVPTIVIQDVLDLLKKGYTRLAKDDAGYGSIQEHYSLTGVQVKELFNEPKLHSKKTIFPRTKLNIVDRDTEPAKDVVVQTVAASNDNLFN